MTDQFTQVLGFVGPQAEELAAADKAKGAAKSAVGGVKDTIRDATKR